MLRPWKLSIKRAFAMLLGAVVIVGGLLFAILETSPQQLVKRSAAYSARELLVTLSSTAVTELQQNRKNVSFVQPPSELSSSTKKKKVVLIVAHGRSGSTLLGNIFNQSPRVFYLFEPLHGVQRIYGRDNKDYDNIALYTLIELFQCNFNEPNFTREVSRFYRFYSNALSSPPFCKFKMSDPRWNKSYCTRTIRPELLGRACKHKYDTIVLKILMDRIPWGSIDKLFDACDLAGVDCKMIHLIRDIRPVVFSSRRVAFFKEVDRKTMPSLREFVYNACRLTEQNLELVRDSNTSLRERYRLVRYEDLVVNPVTFLYELYHFAGLDVLKSIETWLTKVTQPSAGDLKNEAKNPVSSVRNSLEILNKWRLTAEPCEVNVIERYCRPVMDLMGYIPTDGSVELLLQLKERLFTEWYMAQDWVKGQRTLNLQ